MGGAVLFVMLGLFVSPTQSALTWVYVSSSLGTEAVNTAPSNWEFFSPSSDSERETVRNLARSSGAITSQVYSSAHSSSPLVHQDGTSVPGPKSMQGAVGGATHCFSRLLLLNVRYFPVRIRNRWGLLLWPLPAGMQMKVDKVDSNGQAHLR